VTARVTALIPVRAYHPVYLARALQSVVGQTSAAWRLLVIDDGAEGDAFHRVLAPVLSDERVALVRGETPGIAGALNTGIRHATTDFAAFLLGDDMWPADAVEVLTSYAGRFPEVDVFHSSRRFVDAQDRALGEVFAALPEVTLADFVRGSVVKHLLCFRRELALAIGGVDESLPPHGSDDWDFPWSLAEAGARFMAVPEVVYVFRDHRDTFRLTTHVPRSVQVRAMRRILRKHGVGWVQRELRVAVAKRGYLRQSLYRSPLDRWLKERRGFDARSGWRELQR